MFQKPTVEKFLQSTKAVLVDALGDRLVSLIQYGIRAEDEQGNKRTGGKLKLLIIVDQLESEQWGQLGDAFDRIEGKQRVVPMLLTRTELASSTDVFPITFLEMQRNYRVLFGIDLLADLEIKRMHLRLRCEQELKNLQFRMQANYLTQSRSPRQLQESLDRNCSSFVRVMTGALNLVDQSPPESEQELLRMAAGHFKLDIVAIESAFKLSSDTGKPMQDWLTSVYASFLSVVQTAANFVDQLPDDITLIDVVEQGN